MAGSRSFVRVCSHPPMHSDSKLLNPPKLNSHKWGAFNDYVDKKMWLVVQKVSFLSTFRVKNVHVEVGGGQKRAKLCPRSHWMPPYVSIGLCWWVQKLAVFLTNGTLISLIAKNVGRKSPKTCLLNIWMVPNLSDTHQIWLYRVDSWSS